jgi:hypothetical protein
MEKGVDGWKGEKGEKVKRKCGARRKHGQTQHTTAAYCWHFAVALRQKVELADVAFKAGDGRKLGREARGDR